jgi:peptidoglycan/LPS O-acetylase OafA/YrhL
LIFELPHIRTPHRLDIDGLRATAVVPVVLFHARVPGFGGGFVGVDIFFVISGYLITSIIAKEISSGDFSILSFYGRRIRRIFPAFFVMTAFSAVAGVLLLLPSELSNLGSSIVAATFFVSNMLFWQKSGYFGLRSELEPLLHTWSLGIEEQFYLGFPLFLWLWLKFGRARTIWLGVALVAAVSFGVGAYSIDRWQEATFYLILTRAWELLLGAFLAVWPNAAIKRSGLRDSLSIVGLLLIAWPVFTFSTATTFPGLNALFPCVGAALIIVTGMRDHSLAGRMLSNSAFVFTGWISYSFYLWHWPLIVFWKYYFIRPLNGADSIVIIILTFIIATLSWRFVETPFRKAGSNSRRVLQRGGAAMAISAAIGAVFYFGNGLAWRVPAEAQLLASGSTDVGAFMHCIYGLTAEQIKEQRLCKIGAPDAPPSFLLWGDSRAAAIADGIDLQARRHGRSGYYVGMYSCPPLIGIVGWYKENANQHEQCRIINSTVPALIERTHIRTVILHASWSELATEYGTQRVADDATLPTEKYRNQTYLVDRSFRNTLDFLRKLGADVFIITNTPSATYNVPSTLARSAFTGRNVDIRVSVRDFIHQNEFSSELFEQVGRKYHARLIHPEEALCGPDKCAVEMEGRPLFVDRAHLTHFGAMMLAPVLRPIFE